MGIEPTQRNSRYAATGLPERTRLFRLLAAHPDWTDAFRAEPTMLGVIDSYDIELIHPVREGRSPQQIGKKGLANRRWIGGGKLCVVVNQWGLIVDWDWNTANVHDAVIHPMIRRFEKEMIALSDQGFHAQVGDPANLKICPAKTWGNLRMTPPRSRPLGRLRRRRCRQARS